jgi:hypothetical protein
MLKILAGTIVLFAGVLLCATVVAIAIRRFRQDSDARHLLASLAAAVVALASGVAAQLFVWLNLLEPAVGFLGVTASTVAIAYLSSVFSIPVGMGWGWACSFVFNSADALRRPSAPSLVVRGLVIGLAVTSVLVLVVFVGRLAWYGHDNTIGLPGLSVAYVFLGAMVLLAAGVTPHFGDTGPGVALRRIGAGLAAAVILAVGVFVGAVAIDSLLLGARRLAEAWNVLIFFYPFYLMASFAIAGALLFYGGRMFVRSWFRLAVTSASSGSPHR